MANSVLKARLDVNSDNSISREELGMALDKCSGSSTINTSTHVDQLLTRVL